jgi:opacity protein-like surface antigen
LVFTSTNTFSQGNFSVHAGGAIPIGDFGDDDLNSEDAGGAGIGFNLGARFQYPLNEGGWRLYMGADLNLNSLKKSVKDDLEESINEMGEDIDITYYKHFNIPVMAGLYYAYKANESVSIFGELGFGGDFLKMTDMKLASGGEGISFISKSKAQLAYEFGGGLLLQDTYIIKLRYCGLGKHDVSSEVEYEGGSEDMGDYDMKVSLVTISLGFRF